MSADAPISIAQSYAVVKRFWVFVRPYRGKFFLGILLLLFSVPLAQFALFLTRDVTNKALLATGLTADERWSTVVGIVGLQAVFYFSSAILGMCREVLEWYGSMRSTFDLRLAFYKHLNRMPLSYLSKRLPGEHLFRSTADMVSVFRITGRPAAATASGQSAPDSKEIAMAIYSNDVDPYDPGVMGLIVRTVPLIVETLYSLAWGASLLFLIDPVLSVMLVVYIVPFALISNRLFNKVRGSAFRFKQASEVETGSLRDSIAGLKTLKVLGRLKLQRKKYLNTVAHARRAGIRQIAEIVMVQNGVQIGMKWVFSIIIYVYVTSRVMQGSATLGDWVAALLLIEAAQGPLENLVQILQLIKVQLVPAQRILETLDAVPTEVDIPQAPPIGPIAGHIKFESVHFSYDEHRQVLNGVDFQLNAGKYLGIVGPSGAGKSSILALLLRLYSPSQGRILVDGVDISQIQIASLLEQIGTVPQVTHLYSGTIADNILFGNLKASEQELNSVAKVAGVTAFAQRFPDGIYTELGEGSTISGGERQRIGVARAILRNPKLLLLDEATASLDPETEANILREIEGLRGDRTIISVAHRLKAVQSCDHILVLNDGSRAQFGTHAELISVDGLYQTLWQQQSQEVALA